MNNRLQERISHTFQVSGQGGQGACIAVQSVLQEHGFCGYTDWSSPNWHFLYLTQLKPRQIVSLLGDLSKRFKVTIQTVATPGNPANNSVEAKSSITQSS
jgi:hypothetical protein